MGEDLYEGILHGTAFGVAMLFLILSFMIFGRPDGWAWLHHLGTDAVVLGVMFLLGELLRNRERDDDGKVILSRIMGMVAAMIVFAVGTDPLFDHLWVLAALIFVAFVGGQLLVLLPFRRRPEPMLFHRD